MAAITSRSAKEWKDMPIPKGREKRARVFASDHWSIEFI